MRVFVALAVPAAVCAGIMTAFARARSLAPKVKWVAAESMHLTLHFFGEVPDAEIDGFAPVFTDPGLQRPPIRTQLGTAGFFPPSGTPKVLWVGLERGAEEMRAFFGALTERLQPLRSGGPLRQWSPDARGFSPHITVARPGAAPLSPRWAEEAEVPAEEFLVSECVLFQSLLGSAGARYVPLKKITFNGAAS